MNGINFYAKIRNISNGIKGVNGYLQWYWGLNFGSKKWIIIRKAFDKKIKTGQFYKSENKMIGKLTAADCFKYLGKDECDSEL